MEIFRNFLFLSGLVSDTADFRFNLKNLIVLLLNELFDGLESLISLLHTEERFLPIFKQCLFAHNNSFDFNGRFFKGISGGSCLFLL